ncbi:phosphotransferase [Paenibacillus glycanilyticus]|uniref:Membrane protein n=1 Tax=Paenibacillus glycanilyticus TaxID=126569 RepID=A0ABQ6GBX0_9BACL|nr:phosphotransferase [Paenibacillus glycanilyticus]GLX66753.1 membrane protein [Paenibacillus glycanilyticus]
MAENEYNLKFEQLCQHLQLGDLVGTPERLTGGLLHRIYEVKTTLGKYAIKALNPEVMQRPQAINNFRNAEDIAQIAAKHVPAEPAKQFHGSSLQLLDQQYYLVFDWVEGRSLKLNEVNLTHSERMGSILAEIHKTDFSELGLVKVEHSRAHPIDWNSLLRQGIQYETAWVQLLHDNIERLYDWDSWANASANLLELNNVISHLDLDAKNVLWNEDGPILIDWEASGYIHPMRSLTETALYWSETELGTIERDRFIAFVRGYKNGIGAIQGDWRSVLESGYSGMLGWLAYNLKRSLPIGSNDEQEQQVGTEQVIGTIDALVRYADRIDEIEQWLIEESR